MTMYSNSTYNIASFSLPDKQVISSDPRQEHILHEHKHETNYNKDVTLIDLLCRHVNRQYKLLHQVTRDIEVCQDLAEPNCSEEAARLLVNHVAHLMQSSLEVQKEITAVVQTSIYQTQAPKSLSTVHSPTPTAVQESSAYVSDLATQHTTYRYIQDDKHSTESDSALKLCKEQGTRASLSPSPSPSSQPVNRHQRWRLVLSPSTPALGSNSPRTPPCAQPFTPACNFERIYGDRSAPGTCCYCNQAITFQKSQSAEAVLQTLHDSWMASDKDSNGSGSSTVLSTQIHSLSDSTTLNSILDTFPRLETFTRSRSVASSLECLSSDEHGFRSLFRPVMKKKSSLFNLFRPKKNKVTIHDTKLEV